MSKRKQSWLKLALMAVLLLLLAALVFVYFAQEQKSDPASEKIIREAVAKQLDKDPNELSDEDFAGIEEFGIYPKIIEGPGRRPVELSDISLLEKFANLKILSLNYIRYPESAIPKWMKLLTKAGFIDLNKRYALNLSPLKGLKNLRQLHIIETPVSDIEPLKGLTNLQELGFIETHVSDLSPLGGLKNLQRLYFFYETKISDLEPLRGLTNLEEIGILKSACSDIDPLKELTNLRQLFLYEAQVSDEELDELQKALPNLKIERGK